MNGNLRIRERAETTFHRGTDQDDDDDEMEHQATRWNSQFD